MSTEWLQISHMETFKGSLVGSCLVVSVMPPNQTHTSSAVALVCSLAEKDIFQRLWNQFSSSDISVEPTVDEDAWWSFSHCCAPDYKCHPPFSSTILWQDGIMRWTIEQDWVSWMSYVQSSVAPSTLVVAAVISDRVHKKVQKVQPGPSNGPPVQLCRWHSWWPRMGVDPHFFVLACPQKGLSLSSCLFPVGGRWLKHFGSLFQVCVFCGFSKTPLSQWDIVPAWQKTSFDAAKSHRLDFCQALGVSVGIQSQISAVRYIFSIWKRHATLDECTHGSPTSVGIGGTLRYRYRLRQVRSAFHFSFSRLQVAVDTCFWNRTRIFQWAEKTTIILCHPGSSFGL